MRSFKKFPVILFWLLYFLAIAAPCAEAEKSLHSQLKALLIQSQTAKEIRGHFQQKKIIQELGLEIDSSGDFLIQKFNVQDRTLFWSVKKPETFEMCIDKDHIVLQNPKKQVMSLKELSGNTYDQILYLLNLLSFNFNFLEKNFQLSKDKEIWVFRPINDKSFLFDKIHLEIDTKGKIKMVELFERSNDKIQIRFENVRYSNQLKMQKCH